MAIVLRVLVVVLYLWKDVVQPVPVVVAHRRVVGKEEIVGVEEAEEAGVAKDLKIYSDSYLKVKKTGALIFGQSRYEHQVCLGEFFVDNARFFQITHI